MNEKTINCINCGAPVTSEICPYCGSFTGLNTGEANMEYPVLECKEANLGFWTVAFPAIFAVGFGYAGFGMPIMFLTVNREFGDLELPTAGLLFFVPFALIGLVATVLTIIPILRCLKLKIKGKEIIGTVYGYVNDNIMLNGTPAQVAKILIPTPSGPRFIMYQLGKTGHPYGINTKIPILVYKNNFMIIKKKEERLSGL